MNLSRRFSYNTQKTTHPWISVLNTNHKNAKKKQQKTNKDEIELARQQHELLLVEFTKLECSFSGSEISNQRASGKL